MKVMFFDFSILFFCLFFVMAFIAYTAHVMNLVVSLMIFSLLMALMFLSWTCEYMAFTYLIIYFGAVMMLFVFIVMMVDVQNVYAYPYALVNLRTFFWLLLGLKTLCVVRLYLPYVSMKNPYLSIEPDFHFVDLTTTFSVLDAFMAFFNFYWVWLVFIGLLMMVVAMGLVNALLDTYDVMLELYENQKKN